MLFDPASETQMRAAQILEGATMAAFLAAPLFRRRAGQVRITVTGLYIAGVIVIIIYALM